MNIKMSTFPAMVNNSLIDLIISDFRVRKNCQKFSHSLHKFSSSLTLKRA